MGNENEKKTTYTDAQHRAINKYRQQRAQIVLLLEKEQKEQIIKDAEQAGKSVNKYIIDKLLG